MRRRRKDSLEADVKGGSMASLGAESWSDDFCLYPLAEAGLGSDPAPSAARARIPYAS